MEHHDTTEDVFCTLLGRELPVVAYGFPLPITQHVVNAVGGFGAGVFTGLMAIGAAVKNVGGALMSYISPPPSMPAFGVGAFPFMSAAAVASVGAKAVKSRSKAVKRGRK